MVVVVVVAAVVVALQVVSTHFKTFPPELGTFRSVRIQRAGDDG